MSRGASTRGDVKALGARIDEDPDLRAQWLVRARAVGADVADDTPGKKLVRLALARSESAQVRTNPIARDEAFCCQHCARDVPIGGRRPRDHCPWCLHSLHVDVVPGDRAARCGGLLVPEALQPGDRGLDILYRCQACGTERKNRVLADLEVPDDPRAVERLSARA